jgi:hypothetical protein
VNNVYYQLNKRTFYMKLKALLALSLFGVVISSANAKYDVQTETDKKVFECITSKGQYESNDTSIFDSIEFNNSLPSFSATEALDRSRSVTVTYTKSVCGTNILSRFQSNATLPNPDLGEPGDTRTVTQTRGNIRSTYQQTYVSGQGWVTTQVTHTIIIPTEISAPEVP